MDYSADTRARGTLSDVATLTRLCSSKAKTLQVGTRLMTA